VNEEQAALYRRYLKGKPECGDYCDHCGDCLYCGGEMCINGADHNWVIDVGELTNAEKAMIEQEVKRDRIDSNS
jgi:hypothetical protein